MQYRKLGNTDLMLSAVTLGCMTFTGDGNWGYQDERDSIDTVRAALDAGITSFDTAEMYADGYTEEVLGKALGEDRKNVLIFSKLRPEHMSAKDIAPALEGSLSRLGTDYVDLYQIHWPSLTVPVEETMDELIKLRNAGKIREIGISNFGVEDMKGVLPYNVAVSNQLAYSLLFRGIEYSVLPKCIENNLGVLTYSSLAQGLLSGKYPDADSFPVGRARTKIFDSQKRPGTKHGKCGCEAEAFEAIAGIRKICEDIGERMEDVALAWSLAQKGITSVIAGARTPAQVKSNAKGGDIKLSPDTLAALSAATDKVKEYIGDDADPWVYGRIR